MPTESGNLLGGPAPSDEEAGKRLVASTDVARTAHRDEVATDGANVQPLSILSLGRIETKSDTGAAQSNPGTDSALSPSSTVSPRSETRLSPPMRTENYSASQAIDNVPTNTPTKRAEPGTTIYLLSPSKKTFSRSTDSRKANRDREDSPMHGSRNSPTSSDRFSESSPSSPADLQEDEGTTRLEKERQLIKMALDLLMHTPEPAVQGVTYAVKAAEGSFKPDDERFRFTADLIDAFKKYVEDERYIARCQDLCTQIVRSDCADAATKVHAYNFLSTKTATSSIMDAEGYIRKSKDLVKLKLRDTPRHDKLLDLVHQHEALCRSRRRVLQ